MVIPCDRLCPSSETTIWISCHPCPAPLPSPHLPKSDFPPQGITPDLALQLLPADWCARVSCGCSDGLHPVLCWDTVGEMCQTKTSISWWLRTWVSSSTTLCSQRTTDSVFQQAGETGGNTLKSKLDNIYGVLACHNSALTLMGFLLIYYISTSILTSRKGLKKWSYQLGA